MLKALVFCTRLFFLLAIRFDRKLNQENSSEFLIEGTFGTPSPFLDLALDIDSPFSYVFNDKYYNSDVSFAYKSLNYTLKHRDAIGIVSSELMTLNNYSHFHTDKFVFVYLQTYKVKQRSSAYLGFARGNYSLPSQFKTNNVIDKNLFQLTPSSVSVGSLIDDQPESSLIKCKLINDTVKYACRLRGIFFASNNEGKLLLAREDFSLKRSRIIGNDTSLSFSTNQMQIRFPLTLFQYFKENYFMEELRSETCEMIEFSEKTYVLCKQVAVEGLKSIFLAVEGMMIELRPPEFFVRVNFGSDPWQFIMGFSATIDGVVFGLVKIEEYHLVFSEEDNYVGFPPRSNIKALIDREREKEKEVKSASNIIKHFICFDFVLNLIGVAIASMTMAKRRLKF